MQTIALKLSIGYIGCDRIQTVSIEEMGYEADEWVSLSAEERQAAANAYAEEWALAFIHISAKIL
ncbi:MAG: DUF7167 family protein [Microcoleus sp.]